MNRSETLLPILAILTGTCAANAAVLIYEDYDYALADGATMNGVATSATGFSGNYGVGGAGVGSSVHAATGLTFGTNHLPVAGGAIRISSGGGTGNSSILGAAISVGGAQTGTLWNSYLVNFTTKITPQAGGTAQARLSDAQITGTNTRLNVLADNFTNLSTGIAYGGTVTTAGGTALTAGTTYLMLSRFTNAGTAGGGTATLWVYDVAGYDDWLTLGGGLESNLGNYDLASQSSTATTQADFDDGDFYQFAVSSTQGSGVQTAVYDELRWGTSMGDVVSIPEPGTAIAMASGLVMLGFRRRRPLATGSVALG